MITLSRHALLKLGSQMPHHPVKSWTTRITHAARRDKLEKWRRRAEILNRKIREEHSSGDVSQPTPSQVGPPKSPITNPTAPERSTPFDPVNILASFFAEGLADNLTDEQVWNTMARQVCLHLRVPH